jgi:hypothetical protein
MATTARSTQTAITKAGAKPKAKADSRRKPATKGTRTAQRTSEAAKATAKTAPAKRTAHKPAPVIKEKPRECLNGPDPKLMEGQSGIWNTLMDRYFRLEIDGFERLPDEPCLCYGQFGINVMNHPHPRR